MHRTWNNFKTSLLMTALMALCLAVGYAIGGQSALIPALVVGSVMNLAAFFFSDKIALATVRAKPISKTDDPDLWNSVAQLAEKSSLPMPRIYLSPAQAPNAFATGRSPRHSAVCITAGLRQILDHSELQAVLAHELAHIKNRDILLSTIAAIIAGAIGWLSYLAIWSGRNQNRRQNPILAILVLILAPIAATLIQLAISRSREFEADRLGAQTIGTGRPLASALNKLESANKQIPLRVPDSQRNMFIVEPLTAPSAFTKLFMTHPPTNERIARLLKI